MSDSKAKHAEKVEATADLLLKMNSIQIKHVKLNSGISTPYDSYNDFIQRCNENFTQEQLAALKDKRDLKKSFSENCSPQIAASLAFNKILRDLGLDLPNAH